MEVQWGKMEAVQGEIGVSAGSRGRCMEAVVSGLKAGEETAWGTATAGGCKSGRMRRGQRRQGRLRGGLGCREEGAAVAAASHITPEEAGLRPTCGRQMHRSC